MKEFVRSVQYSADRLRALGMSELQIKEVAGNRKVPNNIYLVSPADGFILARNISPGMRFDRQTEFYQIADLSRVWVVAEIFENEAAYFHPGMTAKVTLPGRRQPITARVTNVLPQVDPATRTLRLRLEADNPGFALRPDMFVDVELPVAVPAGLMVPRDAVMDFGLKKRVFVDLGEGVYAPREVETGWQSGDLVQVVRGLAAGDRVVASGTFLLDSESRLRASASASAAPPPDNSAPMSVPMSKSLHSAMTTSTPGQATPLPASLPMDRPAAAGAKSSLPMMPAASKPAGRTARDPKCGMMVDVAEATAAGRTFAYKGTTYYFCSLQDKTDFSRDPERYLNHSAAMASPGMDGHD
jgi:YHS domain-containing protein